MLPTKQEVTNFFNEKGLEKTMKHFKMSKSTVIYTVSNNCK